MRQLNNRGFSAFFGLLLIVGLIAVAGVGYYVYNQRTQSKPASQNSTTNNQSTETNSALNVTKKEDLDTASTYLDSTNVDKQLDTSALDEALN